MAMLNSPNLHEGESISVNNNISTTPLDLNRLTQLISDPSAFASLLQSNLSFQAAQRIENDLVDKESSKIVQAIDTLSTNLAQPHNFLEPILQRLAAIDCPLPGYADLVLPPESISTNAEHSNDTVNRTSSPESVNESIDRQSIDSNVLSVSTADQQSANVNSCQLCDFTCTDKIQYNAHIDAHFDNRCSICNYGTRTKGRLNRHIREFHKELAEQLNLNGASRKRSSMGNTLLVSVKKRKRASDLAEEQTPMSSSTTLSNLIEPSNNVDNSVQDNQSQLSSTSDTIQSSSNGIECSTPTSSSSSSSSSSAITSTTNSELIDSVQPVCTTIIDTVNPNVDDTCQPCESNQPAPTTSKGRSGNGRSRQAAKRGRLKCHKCGHVSESKEEQWTHNKSHMKKEKMLECPVDTCSFSTELKHHLEYHLRKHFNSKPFKCIKCGYLCTNKSMLTSHLKSHSPVYPYRCSDCPYTSKYCHSLKTHLRNFKHNPDKVLNLDGTENPYPIIDVWGTRRGPRPKKGCGSLRLVRQVLQASSMGSETTTSEMVEAILANGSLETDEENLMKLLRNEDEKEDKLNEELKLMIDQQLSEKAAAVAAAAAAAASISSSITNDESIATKEPKIFPKSKPKSNSNSNILNSKSSIVNRKSSMVMSESTSESISSKNNSKVNKNEPQHHLQQFVATNHNNNNNLSLTSKNCSGNQPLNLSSSMSCNSSISTPNPASPINSFPSSTIPATVSTSSTSLSSPSLSSSSSFSSSGLTNASFAQLLQQTFWSQLAMQLMQPQPQQSNAFTTSIANSALAQQHSSLLQALATNPLASNLINSYQNNNLFSNQSMRPANSPFSFNAAQQTSNNGNQTIQQLPLQQLLRSNNMGNNNNSGLISSMPALDNSGNNLSAASLLGLNNVNRSNLDSFPLESTVSFPVNSAVTPSAETSTCVLNRLDDQTFKNAALLPADSSNTTTTITSPSQSELNNLLGYSMLLLKMQQMNNEPRDRLTSNSSRTSSETNSID